MSDAAGTHSEVCDKDLWACLETAVVDLSVERLSRGRQDDHLHGCQLHQRLCQHRQNLSPEQPGRHLTADDRSLSRPQPLIQPRPQPLIQPRPQPLIQPRPQPLIQPRPQPLIQPRPQPLIQPCLGDRRHDIESGLLQTFCPDTHNSNENNSIGDSHHAFSNKCCPRARTGIPKSHAAWRSRGRVLFHLLGLTACLVMSVGYTECRPLSDADKRYRELHINAVKYLAQFGYLRGPSRETQNLQSQEDLTRAIKALQRAGGIPQTGVVDSRTDALMLKPRCGNTDDFVDDARVVGENEEDGYKIRRKRFTATPHKWPHTNITFRFVNYTPDMPQRKTRQLIGEALSVWSNATPLSFTEVRDSSADIMVMFASQYHSDGYPFDGKGMVLGHAFFPGHGKGGDTHFDDDEVWTTNSSDGSGVDLFMVAAHEFGHALGLAHSGVPDSLMYPWYMGFEGVFKLPDDDIAGITSLYGNGEKDRLFPDKAKVNLIPNTSIPKNRDEKPDVEPTRTSDKEVSKEAGKEVSKEAGKEVDKDKLADPCSSPIDAITVIRTDIFLFIGKWFWRLDSRKVLPKPVEIHQFWYGLPKHLEKIDAVFERPDNKIVFFSGDRYWVFNANHLVSQFPTEGRPITEFNIPADVKSINAAFVWGYNKRTYLVSGDMYWKMNENNTFVEYDYPRDMGTWKGVPVPLDAAFKDLTGKTIFFQGLDFWEFYDVRMSVKNGYPKRISQHWLHCGDVPQKVEQIEKSVEVSEARHSDEGDYEDDGDDDDRNNQNTFHQYSNLVVVAVLLVYAIVTDTCS